MLMNVGDDTTLLFWTEMISSKFLVNQENSSSLCQVPVMQKT